MMKVMISDCPLSLDPGMSSTFREPVQSSHFILFLLTKFDFPGFEIGAKMSNSRLPWLEESDYQGRV